MRVAIDEKVIFTVSPLTERFSPVLVGALRVSGLGRLSILSMSTPLLLRMYVVVLK